MIDALLNHPLGGILAGVVCALAVAVGFVWTLIHLAKRGGGDH